MAISVWNEPSVIETLIRLLTTYPYIHLSIRSSSHSFIQLIGNSCGLLTMDQVLPWCFCDWEWTKHIPSETVSP